MKKRIFAILCAAAMLLSLAACGGGGSGNIYNRGLTQQEQQAAYDADIAARVKASIMADARIRSRESITVKSVNGVVELHGEPKSVEDRLLANEAARRVPGVRNVINNMVMN